VGGVNGWMDVCMSKELNIIGRLLRVCGGPMSLVFTLCMLMILELSVVMAVL
jgi:hypothetical protein